MAPPSKLLRWSEVRVWVEDPARRSICALSKRRAFVALARWKAGDPPAHVRYVDLAGARLLGDPSEVDWNGFSPASAELDG